jgi:hypothetical protein
MMESIVSLAVVLQRFDFSLVPDQTIGMTTGATIHTTLVKPTHLKAATRVVSLLLSSWSLLISLESSMLRMPIWTGWRMSFFVLMRDGWPLDWALAGAVYDTCG